jgi:hypothetical protein
MIRVKSKVLKNVSLYLTDHSLGFLGATVCCGLIWLIFRNEYCQIFDCDWGKLTNCAPECESLWANAYTLATIAIFPTGSAATLCISAQILYLVASMFSSYIDEKPRERRARQAQDASQGQDQPQG